tara:strand:+ start:63648 stop:64085 length:438 start_codon:yes stop_codon:yes gene_type:complete
LSSLAKVLKDEIARLARKEARAEAASLQKASAQYRRDIAGLKRQVKSLEQRLSFLEKQEKKRVTADAPVEQAEQVRFSPKYVKSHREKLGFSAADYATLVGVSAVTIYNWEQGKSKPRAQQLADWVAVRDLGKREARMQLELVAT